jgi:chitodextrinase
MNKKAVLAALVVAGFFAAGVFTHVHADNVAPTTPASISATVTQNSQVYVSWSDSTDDVGVVGYYLYRNSGLIATTPGYTYYTDSPLPGVYFYTVAAYDAAGNVSPQSTSASVSVTKDTTPPSAPTGLFASPSSSSVALSWNASTDDTGVVGYYVYRNGVKLITAVPITANSYTDVGLSGGATYNYFVLAYDASGNTSDRSQTAVATVIFDVTPPSTPVRLTTTPISPSEIDLSWQPSTDNLRVAGYYVYRDGYQIANVTSTSYADTGGAPQTTYLYSLVAYDEVNNTSQQTASVGATTFPPDNTPPSIPGNLTAVAPSTSEIDLSWRASTDNTKVAGYYVYRDDVQIATVASTSYVDSNLATDTVYGYAVRAYDTSSNISPQTSVAASTLSSNPITPANIAPPVSNPPPSGTSGNSTVLFTVTLSFGSRSNDVKTLQLFLIQQGDLGATYATGYFGALTQKAVQKFQCDQGVVCSGNPQSTGWGLVGSRTRKALNALQ